jgi:hypothetical protein
MGRKLASKRLNGYHCFCAKGLNLPGKADKENWLEEGKLHHLGRALAKFEAGTLVQKDLAGEERPWSFLLQNFSNR